MTPDEFVAAWDGPRVLLPEDVAPPVTGLGPAVDFLRRAGLPAGVAFGDEGAPYQYSFGRMAHGLARAIDVREMSGPPPASWDGHFLIGDGYLEGGSSWFVAIDARGRVLELDFEADDPSPLLVNGSVEGLAASLVALRAWYARPSLERDVDALRPRLEAADREAWHAGRYWRGLADYIESLDRSSDVFLVGSGILRRAPGP
jgi:hypothetical protein